MEDLIEKFKTHIHLNWAKPLNAQTCIPREIRKLVRDILREYIKQAPAIKGSNPSGRPLNLFYKPYVDQNPVYQKLFENNVWLLESAKSIRDFADMTTVGRFLLTVVYRIMIGGVSNGETIMDNYDQSADKVAIDTQMDYFCYNFMWYMGSIAVYFKNKSLFFGIPMYWWRKEQNDDNIIKKLDEYFRDEDQQEYAKGAIAFVRYISDTYDQMGDNKLVPHVSVSFSNHTTEFLSTVPEFILDGLCYAVWDTIAKYGTTFNLDVFLTLNKYNGAFFKTVDNSKQGFLYGISRPEGSVDCSALRFAYHPGFSRRIETVGAKARKIPKKTEDTYARQHNVETDISPKMFTRNHDQNGYYLMFEHFSSVEEITNNEFERRDRLTYNKACVKQRFLGDADNDRSTYTQMLRDRFMGFIEVRQELPDLLEGEDDESKPSPPCMDVDKLDSLLKPLEESIRAQNLCCSDKVDERAPRADDSLVREVNRPWTLSPPRSRLHSSYGRFHRFLDSPWWRGRHGAIW
ncbi:A-type inclusion protein-like protein [Seal parapoxvirus]|uniref:A-type inclusion protein-like protein n=1 Tax=Seal parapoxvirus TaxID=187984 RepID=A0A1Z3GCR2_9POXV|nr:A-type inclusion protein-like protein [Seal parapoxvirus]ASC55544.1 A-type inclusion protein-like protein [Seal parapoxvirus]